MMKSKKARGLRNNNPLNIEWSRANNWRGQTGSDGRFATFLTMAHGYRAALIVLRSYQRRYGLRTIRQMINRWCLPSERGNDTAAYIRTISELSGIDADRPVDLNRMSDVVKILDAMTYVECGERGYEQEITEAFAML